MPAAIGSIPNAAALLPIQGMCYAPTPSDDTASPPLKYFDSDFTNSGFPLLWGNGAGGRADIANLASNVAVNFVHLYNWSVPPAPGTAPGQYQRSHLSFLDECQTNDVKVFVPISNYFLGLIHQGGTAAASAQTDITAMVTEIYNGGTVAHPAAGIWGIGNEFDLAGTFTVADVATAIQYLVTAEQSLDLPAASLLPITAPVSFADPTRKMIPGIVAIQDLQTAMATAKLTSVWNDRFIASTNPQNGGDFLKIYIDKTFPQYFPSLPYFFAEMGVPIQAGTTVTTEAAQATHVLGQLQASAPRGNFMGACVFQFLDQSAVKIGTEATFGMNKYASSDNPTQGTIEPTHYNPGGGETYNIDFLTQNPMYQSVLSVFKK